MRKYNTKQQGLKRKKKSLKGNVNAEKFKATKTTEIIPPSVSLLTQEHQSITKQLRRAKSLDSYLEESPQISTTAAAISVIRSKSSHPRKGFDKSKQQSTHISNTKRKAFSRSKSVPLGRDFDTARKKFRVSPSEVRSKSLNVHSYDISERNPVQAEDVENVLDQVINLKTITSLNTLDGNSIISGNTQNAASSQIQSETTKSKIKGNVDKRKIIRSKNKYKQNKDIHSSKDPKESANSIGYGNKDLHSDVIEERFVASKGKVFSSKRAKLVKENSIVTGLQSQTGVKVEAMTENTNKETKLPLSDLSAENYSKLIKAKSPTANVYKDFSRTIRVKSAELSSVNSADSPELSITRSADSRKKGIVKQTGVYLRKTHPKNIFSPRSIRSVLRITEQSAIWETDQYVASPTSMNTPNSQWYSHSPFKTIQQLKDPETTTLNRKSRSQSDRSSRTRGHKTTGDGTLITTYEKDNDIRPQTAMTNVHPLNISKQSSENQSNDFLLDPKCTRDNIRPVSGSCVSPSSDKLTALLKSKAEECKAEFGLSRDTKLTVKEKSENTSTSEVPSREEKKLDPYKQENKATRVETPSRLMLGSGKVKEENDTDKLELHLSAEDFSDLMTQRYGSNNMDVITNGTYAGNKTIAARITKSSEVFLPKTYITKSGSLFLFSDSKILNDKKRQEDDQNMNMHIRGHRMSPRTLVPQAYPYWGKLVNPKKPKNAAKKGNTGCSKGDRLDGQRSNCWDVNHHAYLWNYSVLPVKLIDAGGINDISTVNNLSEAVLAYRSQEPSREDKYLAMMKHAWGGKTQAERLAESQSRDLQRFSKWTHDWIQYQKTFMLEDQATGQLVGKHGSGSQFRRIKKISNQRNRLEKPHRYKAPVNTPMASEKQSYFKLFNSPRDEGDTMAQTANSVPVLTAPASGGQYSKV